MDDKSELIEMLEWEFDMLVKKAYNAGLTHYDIGRVLLRKADKIFSMQEKVIKGANRPAD